MTLVVTPIYAALLAVMFVILTLQVFGPRPALADLQKRIRAHGSFAHYAPFGLLLLVVAELAGAASWGLHVSGLCLTVGRGAHALALTGLAGKGVRMAGMALTFVSLALSAVLGLL